MPRELRPSFERWQNAIGGHNYDGPRPRKLGVLAQNVGIEGQRLRVDINEMELVSCVQSRDRCANESVGGDDAQGAIRRRPTARGQNARRDRVGAAARRYDRPRWRAKACFQAAFQQGVEVAPIRVPSIGIHLSQIGLDLVSERKSRPTHGDRAGLSVRFGRGTGGHRGAFRGPRRLVGEAGILIETIVGAERDPSSGKLVQECRSRVVG